MPLRPSPDSGMTREQVVAHKGQRLEPGLRHFRYPAQGEYQVSSEVGSLLADLKKLIQRSPLKLGKEC